MGNTESTPSSRYLVPYVHVRISIDANEYVHVKLFPEDVVTMSRLLKDARNQDDERMGKMPEPHLRQVAERLSSRDPRFDQDVFVAVHDSSSGEYVSFSVIAKRTLADIQKERSIWLEPLGNPCTP